MTLPPVRVFSRERPCTKVHLWNCFHDPATRFGFRPRRIVEAWAEIGKYAPRNMIAKGYAETYDGKNVDMIALTKTGTAWLLEGVQAMVKRSPSTASQLRGFAPSQPPQKRIKRL